jgi:hypothetical protein
MNKEPPLYRILSGLGAIAGIAIAWAVYLRKGSQFEHSGPKILAFGGGFVGFVVGWLVAEIIYRVRRH